MIVRWLMSPYTAKASSLFSTIWRSLTGVSDGTGLWEVEDLIATICGVPGARANLHTNLSWGLPLTVVDCA